MSNSLILGPRDAFDSGRDGYIITLTPTSSEGTTLIGTGGCLFASKGESDSIYAHFGGHVYATGNANE